MATLQAPAEGEDKKKKGPKGGQNDANSDLFKIVRWDLKYNFRISLSHQ